MKRTVTRTNPSQARGKFDYDALVSDRLGKFPFPTLWTTEDLAREFRIGFHQRQHLSRALRRAGIQPSAKLLLRDPATKKKIRTRMWRLMRTRLPQHLHKVDDLLREHKRQWHIENMRVAFAVNRGAQQKLSQRA